MDRLPGFRDFYPEPLPNSEVWSADVRQWIFRRWREVALRYGFREYDGPPLEPLELYTTKSGEEIVGQLYNFIDKGDRSVALRPEMTPTLARMAGAFQRNYPKPLKWFAIPQLFRYERQQKGRLREHFQFNADILGEAHIAADAELVALLIDVLRSFGLNESDFWIRLSSRRAWQDFFIQHGGQPDRAYDFYQVIDKLEREDPAESEKRLQPLGFTLAAVRDFIQAGQPTAELAALLDNLSERGVASYVKVDYNVIRGLAYYTGVVFEAFDRKGEFRAIAGGGRYDHLIKLMTHGKADMPAAGFGMGDVVLSELLRQRGLLPSSTLDLAVYLLIEDESIRATSLRLLQQLRDAGIPVDYSLVPLKSDKQFKRALDNRASYTVRLEKNQAGALISRIKNLALRTEEVVPVEDTTRWFKISGINAMRKDSPES